MKKGLVVVGIKNCVTGEEFISNDITYISAVIADLEEKNINWSYIRK